MSSMRTVFGIPLEDGERVVYYRRDEPGWQKPVLIVLGVLTLVAIIGLFFLAAGLMADTVVIVITTRRFLIVDGKKVEQVRHGQVKNATLRMKGNRPQWFHVQGHDGTQLAFQLSIDAPAMQRAVDEALRAPASLEQKPEVPFDAERPVTKKG
ncbi:MAG: hypothetical protein MUC96_00150 [Myxococcaceae bacterium]|nr:hypothetical protein [Myxococcaceae bacterium]